MCPIHEHIPTTNTQLPASNNIPHQALMQKLYMLFNKLLYNLVQSRFMTLLSTMPPPRHANEFLRVKKLEISMHFYF